MMTWEGIIREEFGFDLFEVIKACAGIEQMRRNKNLQPIRIPAGKLTEWERLEQQYIATIGRLFPQLDASDQTLLLQQFPWVAQC